MTNKLNDITSKDDSIKARGKRLKMAREMTGFSRPMLAKKYGFTVQTIRNWESGVVGGLTDPGAKRMIAALRQEGLLWSLSWLMHGVGSEPILQHRVNYKAPINVISSSEDEEKTAIIEMEFIKQHYSDVADLIVMDDAMQPQYNLGDHVAGQRYYGEAIVETLSQDCIVELVNGDIYFRRLEQGDESNRYHLISTNLSTSAEPILSNQEIISAAPVIWIRRKQFK